MISRQPISDDGKSTKVLYLDRMGAAFVVGHIKQIPMLLPSWMPR